MPDVSLNEYEIYWIGAIGCVIVGVVWAAASAIIRLFKK